MTFAYTKDLRDAFVNVLFPGLGTLLLVDQLG
jgi:hypothetical protein